MNELIEKAKSFANSKNLDLLEIVVVNKKVYVKGRRDGKIVIVITHTPDRVIDLFDKVIVLD